MVSTLKPIKESFTGSWVPASISHHESITNIERFAINRYGRLVIVEMTFTVGTTISEYQAELFSGLPPSAERNMRFRIPSVTDATKPDLVLAVTTGGKIINQWSQGGVSATQWAGQFCYFTTD